MQNQILSYFLRHYLNHLLSIEYFTLESLLRYGGSESGADISSCKKANHHMWGVGLHNFWSSAISFNTRIFEIDKMIGYVQDA
jgi:hypothetical protein